MSGQPQLLMRRPHLRDLPAVELPPGYLARDFRAGDEAGWNRLLDAAFGHQPGHFDFGRMMAADEAFRPQRVKLVAAQADGELVATASAWTDRRLGDEAGLLHWVATDPRHRGRRLGYWVSLVALHHAALEDRRAVYLRTDDQRLPAVVTYLRMGFAPVKAHESHPERWRRVLADLGWPQDFEEILRGPLESFG